MATQNQATLVDGFVVGWVKKLFLNFTAIRTLHVSSSLCDLQTPWCTAHSQKLLILMDTPFGDSVSAPPQHLTTRILSFALRAELRQSCHPGGSCLHASRRWIFVLLCFHLAESAQGSLCVCTSQGFLIFKGRIVFRCVYMWHFLQAFIQALWKKMSTFYFENLKLQPCWKRMLHEHQECHFYLSPMSFRLTFCHIYCFCLRDTLCIMSHILCTLI